VILAVRGQDTDFGKFQFDNSIYICLYIAAATASDGWKKHAH